MDNSENENKQKKVKNSLVLSGLVGTAGLFIAKLLGLLYSIPLSSILGSDALMSYYGTSYLIYSYVLNVFTAGVPFAISAIVAKYTILDDNKSLVALKKMSITLLTITGFIGMALLILLSGTIAYAIVPDQDSSIMATSLQILSLAIFLVPILSAFRGFWQGRKEMEEYAFTQVFEQLIRVGFLLSVAYLIVYVLHMDRTYALYAAVLSTSVAALAALIQIYFFDRKHFKEIKNAADKQEVIKVQNKELFHELILLAIPYLLSAIIGYITQIYDSILLPIGLRMHGYNTDDINVIISAINYVGAKLTSIPEILSPGFIAALIPHITEAMTQKNHERVSRIITECIGIVVFIGSAISLCIGIYSTDIYHMLFYTSDINLASNVIKWIAIDGFMGTICPVTSMIGIAMGYKRKVLRNQLMDAVIKGVTMIPLIYWIGFPGAIISSFLGNIYTFSANTYVIHKEYNIDFSSIFKTIGKMCAALAAMILTSFLLRWIGLDGATGPKLAAFFKFILNALLTLGVYIGVSEALKIPNELFHRNFHEVIMSRIKHKKS